jgi:hypothetical protein
MSFFGNNSLLARIKRALNWQLVGPTYWSGYQSSIQQTTAVTTVADTLTTPNGTYPGSAAFHGGILLPDGRVFCVPSSSTTARIYNPVTDTLTTPSGTYPDSFAFWGGILLPDGSVFCVPRDSTTARIYNPVTDTLTTPSGTYPGNNAFHNGVLLPDGRVFCVPFSSSAARIYGGGGGFNINVSLSAYYNKL